jgi:AcrR family transcriptional regulator
VESERPRQARAERTRARIVETAAAAFAQHGFEGVSLNDLVQVSGLSKGAFYFHFGSKEDVALAAFRAKQEELVTRLVAGDEMPASPTERVVLLVKRRAQLLAEDLSLRCVTRLGSELNVRSGPGSEYASFQDLGIELIADLVEDGQRAGEFRSNLEPQAVARTLFAWIVGIDTLSQLFSDGKDLQERSEEMLTLLLPALTAATQPEGRVPRRPAVRRRRSQKA